MSPEAKEVTRVALHELRGRISPSVDQSLRDYKELAEDALQGNRFEDAVTASKEGAKVQLLLSDFDQTAARLVDIVAGLVPNLDIDHLSSPAVTEVAKKGKEKELSNRFKIIAAMVDFEGDQPRFPGREDVAMHVFGKKDEESLARVSAQKQTLISRLKGLAEMTRVEDSGSIPVGKLLDLASERTIGGTKEDWSDLYQQMKKTFSRMSFSEFTKALDFRERQKGKRAKGAKERKTRGETRLTEICEVRAGGIFSKGDALERVASLFDIDLNSPASEYELGGEETLKEALSASYEALIKARGEKRITAPEAKESDSVFYRLFHGRRDQNKVFPPTPGGLKNCRFLCLLIDRAGSGAKMEELKKILFPSKKVTVIQGNVVGSSMG